MQAIRPLVTIISLTMLTACGNGNGDTADAAPPDSAIDAPAPGLACDDADVIGTLATQAFVREVEEIACAVEGEYRCFRFAIEQAIDHGDPDSDTFLNYLNLLHRSCDAPMVLETSGYSLFPQVFAGELSSIYGTNELVLEHRYIGTSAPNFDIWDWDALTIANGAADVHRVVTSLRSFYTKNWITTGGSKNGITAVYHRYHYPDDVDGTVPYVAPASLARRDLRYQSHMSTIAATPCGARVSDAQVAILTTRRDAMRQRVIEEYDIAASQSDEALERITDVLDWSFWQYYGEPYCFLVPTQGDSDLAHWEFLDLLSNGQFNQANAEPDSLRDSYALYYEWLTEQGFAWQTSLTIEDLLVNPRPTMEEIFRAWASNPPLPSYDSSVTQSVVDWVANNATSMVLIYGEYDPWTGGELPPPSASDSGKFTAPAGAHWTSLEELTSADYFQATQLIADMLDTPAKRSRSAVPVPGHRARLDHMRRHEQAMRRLLWKPHSTAQIP